MLLPLMVALAVVAGPATAALIAESGQVVSGDPVDWTPHVLDGEVRAMAVVGDTVVVGGDFTGVTDHTGTRYYERWYLFAFELGTGRILDFDPRLSGPVLSLEPGPAKTVYAGGRFPKGVTRLELATGRPVPHFRADLEWGDVRSVALSRGKLYIGGSFDRVNGVKRAGLARLDATTGRVDPDFDAQLAAPEIGRVKVEDLAVSPSGDRLVVIGAITWAGYDRRVQVAMFDLTHTAPMLADWWTDAFDATCKEGFDTWLRAVDFSPGGDYLVIVTTGRHTKPHLLCDTASRFETYVAGKVEPTWVNHTGGDSLYAVEVTEGAVYVGGHQRWMDNPHGDEFAGPGASSRVGVAAIDPVSGRAIEWNPGRSRGVGVRVFLMTDRGLLVGSDTDELALEYHGRIGLFPP